MPDDLKVRMLRGMMRIRCSEETLAELYAREQEMRTPTHFSMGQEAIAVGVCAALDPADVAYSGHRCHAHYLAKGGDLLGMVAELYGREIGCAHGRGGSVHLNDQDAGLVASSAILGETIATAVGSAWAFAMDGVPRVAVCFFGDGATEEGIFHECLNFALVRKLPVLFVCENNGLSTHTRLSVRQPAGGQIWERVQAFGLPTWHGDGNDVFGVYEAARKAVDWCRSGQGPYFLEFETYRWREHVGPLWDYEAGYRTKAEVDSWIARCPIERARATLLADGHCTEAELTAWQAEFQREIDQAIATSKAAPYPAVDDLMVGTY